jgi:hypothetical protein
MGQQQATQAGKAGRIALSQSMESGRQSCLKIDPFSGDGVVEFQKLGVQEISSIAGEAGKVVVLSVSYGICGRSYWGLSDT